MSAPIDVVVIGAGLAGLSAAAHLAQAGQRVVVCEQHNKPGGYYTSFVREGMIFDITAHWTIDHDKVNALLAHLGGPPIDFVPHRHIGQYMGPGHRSGILLVDDRHRFEQSILENYPTAPQASIHRLIDLALKVDDEFRSVQLRSAELLSPAGKAAMLVQLPLKMRTFLKYSRISAEALLLDLFPGDELAGLRAALYMLAPIPGIASFGMLLYIAFALSGRAWVPRGGALQAAVAFEEAARRNGVTFRYNTLVTGIDVEQGRATGVRLATGETIRARSVISAADSRATFGQLLDSGLVPDEYRQKLARTPVSISFVIVSLVLNRDPATFGLEPMDAFFTDTADLDAMLAADDPEHTFFSVQFPEFRTTDADPNLYGLQILAPASFGYEKRWGTQDDGARGAEYERLKADFAARLLARAETRMPGLRNHIVQTDVSTPITMQRYTRNDMGSPVGWSYTSTERWKQRVPFVPGLYLAGHWVGPSGIFNVATSGRNAAELILRDRRKGH